MHGIALRQVIKGTVDTASDCIRCAVSIPIKCSGLEYFTLRTTFGRLGHHSEPVH